MSSLPGHLTACLIATVLFLFLLAHFTLGANPITLHVQPRIGFAPADLAVQIVVVPLAQDREETLLLCDLSDRDPCTVAHHERMSQRSINGDQDSPIWAPAPWKAIGPGEFAVVAAIGPRDQVRASAVARVTLMAP